MLNPELDKMLLLKRGWNGYDADPPNLTSVLKANNFLKSLPKPDRIAPSAVGGIAFIWKIDKDKRVYLEFLNNGGDIYIFVNDSSYLVTSPKQVVDEINFQLLHTDWALWI